MRNLTDPSLLLYGQRPQDLSADEARMLALLEIGALDPDVACYRAWEGSDAQRSFGGRAQIGSVEHDVVQARAGRQVLLSLQRRGLAHLAGTQWQVTAKGRRVAGMLEVGDEQSEEPAVRPAAGLEELLPVQALQLGDLLRGGDRPGGRPRPGPDPGPGPATGAQPGD